MVTGVVLSNTTSVEASQRFQMPDSSDQLPPEFFMNPRCPPARAPTDATTAEVDQSEATKEPERSAPAGDQR